MDVSAEGVAAIKKRLPHLKAGHTWEEAAEVLAWFLRAWDAKDPVLKFVSLFIPLECVIPALPKEESEKKEWERNRQVTLALVKAHAEPHARKSLNKFITELQRPPPLSERFKSWATTAKLPGWKNDVAAFLRFYKIRNSLVHRGQSDVQFRVTVEPDDVRTLEDLAERYVSLALFGDADVYQSKKRPSRANANSNG